MMVDQGDVLGNCKSPIVVGPAKTVLEAMKLGNTTTGQLHNTMKTFKALVVDEVSQCLLEWSTTGQREREREREGAIVLLFCVHQRRGGSLVTDVLYVMVYMYVRWIDVWLLWVHMPHLKRRSREHATPSPLCCWYRRCTRPWDSHLN